MLFQTIIKQILAKGDKLLPVRDTRVKVFCLFSGATRYVPSTSANFSNTSYKLLVCELRVSCWERLPSLPSVAGLGHPSTIYG